MTKEFYIDNLPFDKFFLAPPETIYVTDLCGYPEGTKITFMLEEDGVKEGPYSGYLKLMSKDFERLNDIH